jgi:hypothetical protein
VTIAATPLQTDRVLLWVISLHDSPCSIAASAGELTQGAKFLEQADRCTGKESAVDG